jgi:hypothetical protein
MGEIDNCRRAPRIPVLSPAKAYSDGSSYHCVVRDCSTTGLKLGISRDARLTPVFQVEFPQQRLKASVRLRWRRGDLIGVSFCAADGLAQV